MSMSIVVQFGRQLAGRGCQHGGAPVEEQGGWRWQMMWQALFIHGQKIRWKLQSLFLWINLLTNNQAMYHSILSLVFSSKDLFWMWFIWFDARGRFHTSYLLFVFVQIFLVFVPEHTSCSSWCQGFLARMPGGGQFQLYPSILHSSFVACICIFESFN